MGRRSKKKEKAEGNPGGSKYALKVKRRKEYNDESSETQHTPIERPTLVLTEEQKQLLRTEMEYGLDERMSREYTESELKYIVGYCLTNNLINNFKFLPFEAARYIAPVLGYEKKRDVAIEALKRMNSKAARYIAPVLGDGSRKKRDAAIEAIYRMELTHKGRAVGIIIRKYSEETRETKHLLNSQIYSAIKKIYQMENSPIKRYMDLAMKLVREENKPKFFSGLEKVLTT